MALPPPYEVDAYARPRPRRLLTRRSLSLRSIVTGALTVSVFWLCLIVRNVPRRATGAESKHFADALDLCRARTQFPSKPDPATREANSRWAAENGQKVRIVLKNATLFDGEDFVAHAVDITFSRGLIESVTESGRQNAHSGATVYDLHGRFVTPGLVDMHSHHYLLPWPVTEMVEDSAEVNTDTMATTSMMRVIDALKAYDPAANMIASGGVTTSLIIPGSANLIGGEGVAVKNALYSGKNAEPVVEELLLERGLPAQEHRRYMKMAMGENPKRVWKYSRFGNAWYLRKHFQKAKDLIQSQDDYCTGLEAAKSWSASARSKFIGDNGRFPSDIALESVAALLRGQVQLHNHNYEPQDIETMIRISEEFGYKITGLHHATEAWQIAGMLKERVPNVTIATFAEFSLYKHEAYSPSLYAGQILDKSGIKVAYKSDHVATFTNAKFLLSQAAVAHSFHLPAQKALQAVTSVPAAAIDQDHRVGYCRPGYDADIVVWDEHPLSRGATPLQVFIDGIKQLNETQVEKSMGTGWTAPLPQSATVVPDLQVRYELEDQARDATCNNLSEAQGNIVITGISRVFLDSYPELAATAAGSDPLQMIVQDGKVTCVGASKDCEQSRAITVSGHHSTLNLSNGHVMPGLTALTNSLGMREITTEPTSGDGDASGQNIAEPDTVTFAKHGIWLDGKVFSRARLGGVTRAITPPISDGGAFLSGVSVEILTSGKKSLLNGGIVQEDVALHMALGDASGDQEGSVSSSVQKLRKMLSDGLGKNNETIYGRVAAGDLPLLVHANNKVRAVNILLTTGQN